MDTEALIKRIEMRLKEIGMNKRDFYKTSGISSATYSQWNTGLFKPSKRKVQAAADALGVSYDYLITGEETKPSKPYYLNDETAEIAQEIFENKELRALFDVTQNADAEDLRALHNMALALKRKERGNDETGC